MLYKTWFVKVNNQVAELFTVDEKKKTRIKSCLLRNYPKTFKFDSSYLTGESFINLERFSKGTPVPKSPSS